MVASERIPFGGAIVAWLFGLAWSLITMFAVPVLAVEDVGPRRAGLRSVEIFRARWGEGVIGTAAVAGATAAVSVPAVVLAIAGVLLGGPLGIAMAAAFGLAPSQLDGLIELEQRRGR